MQRQRPVPAVPPLQSCDGQWLTVVSPAVKCMLCVRVHGRPDGAHSPCAMQKIPPLSVHRVHRCRRLRSSHRVTHQSAPPPPLMLRGDEHELWQRHWRPPLLPPARRFRCFCCFCCCPPLLLLPPCCCCLMVGVQGLYTTAPTQYTLFKCHYYQQRIWGLHRQLMVAMINRCAVTVLHCYNRSCTCPLALMSNLMQSHEQPDAIP